MTLYEVNIAIQSMRQQPYYNIPTLEGDKNSWQISDEKRHVTFAKPLPLSDKIIDTPRFREKGFHNVQSI